MADKFVITESDIDRELDLLVEVSRAKRKKLDKKLKAAQQEGRGWWAFYGDKRGHVAVNPDGEVKDFRQLQFDNDLKKAKGAAECWAKGEEKYPCEEEKEEIPPPEENKCPPGFHWVPAEPIAEAEGEGEAIPTRAEGKCVKDGEDEEEEQEDKKEKPAQIIIPDWNPDPGQAINWMGRTSFSGDTAGKMVNDFLKDKPGIGRYAYEFSKLLRVYATMKLIQVAKGAAADHSKLLKSKEAELDKEEAELDKDIEGEWAAATAKKKALEPDAIKKRAAERVAKKRAMAKKNRDLAKRMGGPQGSPGATLQEVISPGLLKDIEDQFKDYLKSVVRQAIGEADNKEEFSKFVEGEIKKLKGAKTIVDASEDLTKAYNDVSDYGKLVGRLMIKLANILDQNWRDLFPILDKDPEEEEETVIDSEEEEATSGSGRTPLQEDKLTEIVIDFNEIRKNELNESFLVMFGAWIKHILGAMLGDFNIPVSVRGSRGEVESFARAVGGEKKYVETAKRYGLDHPNTYKSQARLRTATKSFEKETGIKWPFK